MQLFILKFYRSTYVATYYLADTSTCLHKRWYNQYWNRAIRCIYCKKDNNHFPHPDEITKTVHAAVSGAYRLSKNVNDSTYQVMAISILSMRNM